MHAFDTAETPVAGSRSGEWIAAARVYRVVELHCVEVIARCLAEIKAGRWPK